MVHNFLLPKGLYSVLRSISLDDPGFLPVLKVNSVLTRQPLFFLHQKGVAIWGLGGFFVFCFVFKPRCYLREKASNQIVPREE